jgi:predicted N-acyltransferase
LRRVTAREASRKDWDFFVSCYRRTYREHRSTPYLTRELFGELARRMPDQVLLVIAEREGRSIAAALDLFGDAALYGRYWGTIEHVPGLHFEACYYQAIEFCIERGIALFEGGAQGEHKHARGFLPETTRSFHWLAHPAFNRAVDEFLAREGAHISAYVDELADRSPFKKGVRHDFE